jgi:UDP-N-acetylmuramate dehydrogenase
MSLQVDSRTPLRTNVSLRPYSTLKIGGNASYFAEPSTLEDLRQALLARNALDCPMYLLGRGSNLLFSDLGFSGLILSMKKFEAGQMYFDHEGRVRVPAGLSLIQLSTACQERGLSGAEFLCHIPGTVGGAVVMNSGFGRPDRPWREMKDIIESVEVMYLDGRQRIYNLEGIQFGYRSSDISRETIVLEATLKLTPGDPARIKEEIALNFQYRNAVQDLRFPSAGSTFKNPSGFNMSSGQMLDRVGMKGERVGDAMVSEKHANFFLNVGRAKAEDVLTLMRRGQTRVFERFGVELEPEVRYVQNGTE